MPVSVIISELQWTLFVRVVVAWERGGCLYGVQRFYVTM